MFVKRALHSLKHHLVRNLILVLLYTAIFAVMLAVLNSYLTVERQVSYLQSTLGSSVTLLSPTHITVYEGGALGGGSMRISEEAIHAFTDSFLVRGYNVLGMYAWIDMENVEPVVPDYARDYYEWREKNAPESRTHDGWMLSMQGSEFYEGFTLYGYRLVKGRHFTGDDVNAVLISRALAERNGLTIGDTITFSTANQEKLHPIDGNSTIQYATLEIIGLFDPPDREENRYEGSLAEDGADQLVFASAAGAAAVLDPDGVLDGMADGCTRVTVYLNSPADMDRFLEEMQGKMNIAGVVGSISGSTLEWKGTSEDESRNDYFAAYKQNPHYYLVVDQEFYDYVGTPMEHTRAVMGTFLIALLSGSLVILILLMAVFVRTREKEFGILLAMGESKTKIVAQILLETMAPFFLAILLGVLVSRFTLVPQMEAYTSGLLQGQVTEGRAERQELLSQDRSDHLDDGIPYDTLRERNPLRAVVAKDLDFSMDSSVYSRFLGICLASILAASLVQILFLLRMSPARLLSKK